MARTDTLGNFLTDVAEAIRTKEGTTKTIPASEFDTRISNLSGGGEPEVEPDYITNGLVAWWDGADEPDENGDWVSRVGTDYISQFTTALGDSTKNKFGILHSKKDKCYRNNAMYGLTNQVDYFKSGYTVEVVGKVTSTATSSNLEATGDIATLFAFNKGSSPCIALKNNTGDFCALNSSKATYPVTYTNLFNKRLNMCINLNSVPSRTAQGQHRIKYSLNGRSWQTIPAFTMMAMSNKASNSTIMCLWQDSQYACCEINSIRIYNRELTADELLHNYQEDLKRFKLDNDGN